ncbi:hypothetical protein AWE51_06850 [Aquimarina aggregata]|uniref:Sensor of ECF-type sigma factor n=1 Tax=Aquimarina aggregata TaxID=1642818 RepID=A0A163AMX3_9FLAO|nr:hypothetical protein [Aquimarina aggregata]KZS40662.1 hypothetical protein AWE51_06850 [Aquimarina aggregata]
MYGTHFITIFLACFCFFNIQAQELTDEQKERLEYKVDIFSSGEKELQRLWYEDRMDKMKLRGELRKDYHNIVVYHAYKMKRLDDLDKGLNDNKIRKQLQKQLLLLHEDVEDILSLEQFEIHEKSWEAILKAVLSEKELN